MYLEEIDNYKKNLLVYRAICKKQRLQLLDMMHKREQEIVANLATTSTDVILPHVVEDFYGIGKLYREQSVASQELAILRRQKLVEGKRNGKFIHYSLTERGKQILEQCSVLLVV